MIATTITPVESMSQEAWIETHSGRKLCPLNPNLEDIAVEDIVHALSFICRFTGHTNRFWSVAQHCLLIDDLLVDAGYAEDYEMRLIGLLHDATEAYMCDLPKPLKVCMPEYKSKEFRLESAIAEKFEIPHPWPKLIKEFDVLALAIEAHDLMPSKGRTWDWDVESIRDGRSIPEELHASPEVVKARLLDQIRSVISARVSRFLLL